MTLKEKILLCEGVNFWETKAVPEYGISSMYMCDGPHGIRRQDNKADHLGMNRSNPATCFPTAVSTACSWDEELLGRVGATIAKEAADQKIGVFLGPGVNIKRNPLCGRNFEYFSEDPYLTGKLAASYINKAQQNGIGTSLKHFACNEQEYKRFQSDSVLDERALREIYLTAFEMAVTEGKPKTVMCAYNKINGEYCSDSVELLTTILREEWKFDGLVMTDWGAMNNRIMGFKAGCDLNMPGGSDYMLQETINAVNSGELNEADIDRSVQRVIKMVKDSQKALELKVSCDYDLHHRFACEVAEQSAVLLKNENGILPLKEDQTIAIVGEMATNMRYQGTGSSYVNPTRIIRPADVLTQSACVSTADIAIVFTGLPEDYESEGFDRDDMKMPSDQVKLIEDTARENPNTIVVLFCGAPVEVPWEDKVKAILYMGLPGQGGGEAVKNLLYGKVNPSGKLAETWPMTYSDVPSSMYYAQRDAHYRESIYVGYRYYDKAKVSPRWRFGYGLSYTRFSYSDAYINEEDKEVRFTLSNGGERDGGEVISLYVTSPQDGIHRPIRELKGFQKVYLRAGESTTLKFKLDDRCFAIWNEGWKIPSGEYGIYIGGNPEKLMLAGSIKKSGGNIVIPDWQPDSWYEQPYGTPSQAQWEAMLGRKCIPQIWKKGEFTMNNSVIDMKESSSVMRFMYRGINRTISKSVSPGTAKHKMYMESSAGSPLRSMQISGGVKANLLQGLLAMANGKFLRGLSILLKRAD